MSARKIQKKSNIVVYTAIFGNYDVLNKVPHNINCDFVCFTDNSQLKSKKFDIRLVESTHSDSTRNARMYKVLPHKFLSEYKYSIWIDASMKLKKNFDPEKMIEKYLKNEKFAIFKHDERDCVYDEFEICIKHKRDNVVVMQKQRDFYKESNYPKHTGLVSSGFIIREHNDPHISNFDDMWWKEICKFSKRDQLSFNYVAHKINLHYTKIEGNIFNNKNFFYVGHNGFTPRYRAFMKHALTFLNKINPLK